MSPEAVNKEMNKVLHLTKSTQTINTVQVYLLPWEQGLSCSQTQVKLVLKEE